MSTSAGASRVSSVPGLNARPHTAIRLPFRLPPKWASTFSPSFFFWRSLTATTAFRICSS